MLPGDQLAVEDLQNVATAFDPIPKCGASQFVAEAVTVKAWSDEVLIATSQPRGLNTSPVSVQSSMVHPPSFCKIIEEGFDLLMPKMVQFLITDDCF